MTEESQVSDSDVGSDLDDNMEANDERELERKTLARTENQAVSCLRVFVFFVLVLTMVIVSVAVFNYVRGNQEAEFAHEFQAQATKVVEAFQTTIARQAVGLEGLATALTSHAIETGETWPNVTLPNYAMHASNARILSALTVINFQPIVTEEQRSGWEAYATEKRDRVFYAECESDEEQRSFQDSNFNTNSAGRTLQLRDDMNRTTIHNLDLITGLVVPAPPNSGINGLYNPIWQMSPVSCAMKLFLYFNSLSFPLSVASTMAGINTGKLIMDQIGNPNGENLGDTGVFFRLILKLGQFRADSDELLLDPTTPIVYPVFDSFNHKTRKPVATLGSTMIWKFLFEKILPPTSRGIYCVIENTANQTITYRLDHGKAVYIGSGDLHDAMYDDFEVISQAREYVDDFTSPATKSYTSAEVDFDFLSYTLRVYPSEDTEALYVNNDAVVFTVVVLCVFLFTSLVFITYDRLVARRQRIVMERALDSGAIVSSLFPSQVREQIYQENKQAFAAVQRLMSEGSDDVQSSRAIAQAYENTTIMFADLKGFTKWSSSRSPEQVFFLLETIYQAFDVIALRRKVFKVETIGDCYVAVAGLPQPQRYHAVVMARFARDCLLKLREITISLAQRLGDDTVDLELRVGLHSGNVTGGVLRGQKGRFQLFGDAMNVASRMETNGEGGRIHVSQETADELKAKGKEEWVSAREDKIVAKGKGELQTYWILPRDAANSHGFTESSMDHSSSDSVAYV